MIAGFVLTAMAAVAVDYSRVAMADGAEPERNPKPEKKPVRKTIKDLHVAVDSKPLSRDKQKRPFVRPSVLDLDFPLIGADPLALLGYSVQ